MNFYNIILCLIILTVLSGCTNEQIQEAIDECKGDPECTEIIDDVITDELEARGISGGKMTVAEMEGVYDLLGSYQVTLPDISNREMLFEIFIQYLETCRYNVPELDEQYDKFGADLHLLFGRSPYEELVYQFEEINTENKQYLIYDDMRFIIYKTGVGQFHYEIQGDYLIEFTIDTELNKLYKDNSLQDYNVYLIDELFEGLYSYDNGFLFEENNIVFYLMQTDDEYTRFGLYDLLNDKQYEIIFGPGVVGISEIQNGWYEYVEFSTIPFQGNIIDYLLFLQNLDNYTSIGIEDSVTYFTEMHEYIKDIEFDFNVAWDIQ